MIDRLRRFVKPSSSSVKQLSSPAKRKVSIWSTSVNLQSSHCAEKGMPKLERIRIGCSLREIYYAYAAIGASWRIVITSSIGGKWRIFSFTYCILAQSAQLVYLIYLVGLLFHKEDKMKERLPSILPFLSQLTEEPQVIRRTTLLGLLASIFMVIFSFYCNFGVVNALRFVELQPAIVSFTNDRAFVLAKKRFSRAFSTISVICCVVFALFLMAFDALASPLTIDKRLLTVGERRNSVFTSALGASESDSSPKAESGYHLQFIYDHILCAIFEYYVNFVSRLTVLFTAALYLIVTCLIRCEASHLLADVGAFPTGTQSVELLLYRYQALTCGVDVLNRRFGLLILTEFITLFACAFSVFASRASSAEVVVQLCSTCAIILTIFWVQALTAILTNNKFQLVRFRDASHKFSDFSNICANSAESMKLLSFVMQLSVRPSLLSMGLYASGDRGRGIGCAVTWHSVITVLIVGATSLAALLFLVNAPRNII